VSWIEGIEDVMPGEKEGRYSEIEPLYINVHTHAGTWINSSD